MAHSQPKISGCTVELSGQVALVTGASRGIGRAIAIRLAHCGARVAAVATSVEGKLAETVQQIREAGGSAEAFAGDVGKSEDVTRIVGEVESQLGRIDVLVNCAGVTRDGLLLRMDDADWDTVIRTNLSSVFYFCRAAGAVMMRQRYGRIINITSTSALMGNPGQANYSASKAGVIGFTKTVAKELAKRNITVNAVAPGFTVTDMTEVLPEKVKEFAKQMIPVNRFGQPDDIADIVCCLAGPGAGYLTGQVIAVDGGMTA